MSLTFDDVLKEGGKPFVAFTVADLGSPQGVALPAGEECLFIDVPAPPRRNPKISDIKPHPSKNGKQPRFEGAEHTKIGDSAYLWFADGVAQHSNENPLSLPNGLRLTYGQIVALGGDFYGVPDSPISDGDTLEDRKQRFREAFNSLAVEPASVDEAQEILDIMQVEIDAVAQAISEGHDPSAAYESLGDELSARWNCATGGGSPVSDWFPLGRYLKLAQTNWDHFAQHARDAYIAGHQVAQEQAIVARGLAGEEQRSALELAYAMNAFADHFLTDLFSAGHMRTPRKALYEGVWLSDAGSVLSRYMHDEDCRNGLLARNSWNQVWRAYGDKKYLDPVNRANRMLVDGSVIHSAREVRDAFQGGQVEANPANYMGLQMTPDLEWVQDESDHGRNPSPLFRDTGSVVERRKGINDLYDHQWTDDWWGPTTLADMSLRYAEPALDQNRQYPGPITAPSRAPTPNAGHGHLGTQTTFMIPGLMVRYSVSFYRDDEESDRGPWSAWIEFPSSQGWIWQRPEKWGLSLRRSSEVILRDVPRDETGQATGLRVYRELADPNQVLAGARNPYGYEYEQILSQLGQPIRIVSTTFTPLWLTDRKSPTAVRTGYF